MFDFFTKQRPARNLFEEDKSGSDVGLQKTIQMLLDGVKKVKIDGRRNKSGDLVFNAEFVFREKFINYESLGKFDIPTPKK